MKYLNLIILLLFLFSCQDKKKNEIKRLVSEWQGKEIIFPDTMVFTIFGTDTVNYEIPSNTNYKVLIYVDSIGCTSCKLQLSQWKKMINYTDSITRKKLPYLFFFHSKDYKETHYLLKRDNFDLPVCIDKQDILNKTNRFPNNIMFQTFLLDKNNKVVVIGNPIHNLAVKDLYIKRVTRVNTKSDISQKTTVEIEKVDIHLGTFDKSEIRKAIFVIKNTGSKPLVIFDTSTTCGCTTPIFNKIPINPGDTTHVIVQIKPKDSGFFSETITLKCNTEQSVKLKITGLAQ